MVRGANFVKMTVRTFRQSADQLRLSLVTFEEATQTIRLSDNPADGPTNLLLIDQLEKEIRQMNEHSHETSEQAESKEIHQGSTFSLWLPLHTAQPQTTVVVTDARADL